MFRILAQSVTDVNILDVITKVDSLYNNAYNRLFIIFAAGFALVGVITPFFVQLIQRHLFLAEKDEILKQTKKEMKQLERKFKKELATDSAIHFREHAKNLPGFAGHTFDTFCLTILSAKKFAEAKDIYEIHLCFEAINELQLPMEYISRDIEKEHTRLLSQYNAARTAIKENGFEEKLADQLKTIETKIETWYDIMLKNKKS